MTDIRCALLDGDRTTTGGVLIGTDNSTHHGTRMAVRGDFATCPACKDGGLVFNDCDPSFTLMGKDILVEGARVHCNCPTKPRVLASQNTFTIQVNRGGSHALMQPLFGRSDNGAQSSNESDEVIEQYFELVDAKTGRPEEGYRHDLFCDGRRVNQDASFGGRSAVVGGRVAMSIVLWLDKSRGFRMTDPLKASLLTSEERLLAAIVYGESSTLDQYEEMAALASVMVRQMKSRGYWTIEAFTSKDRNFSFVHTDGNARYARLMRASETDIARSTAMSDAVNAARNAFAGGPDYPKGAYFWDGADIKSNYARHAKVRSGIHISDPAHNVYGISDSGTTRILYRTVRKRVNGRSGPSNSKWDDICGCMNLRLASGEQFSGAMGATGFELPEQRNTNDASDCFHGFMGAMPDGPSRASIRSGHGRLPLVRQGGTIDQRDPV